jgi:hypothetical protein
MYKVPFFKPFTFPVRTKFFVDCFSLQETKIKIESNAIIDLYMFLFFGNNTKKNPQSDEQIEDLKYAFLELAFQPGSI